MGVGKGTYESTGVKMEEKKNYFKDWYAKNKDTIAARRAKRYAEDPAYRARQQELARESHKRRFGKRSIPDVYVVRQNDIGNFISGLTIGRIRSWRENGYIPEPFRKHNEVWFTHKQVQLMRALHHYFESRDSGSARIPAREKGTLEDLVRDIKESWNGAEYQDEAGE